MYVTKDHIKKWKDALKFKSEATQETYFMFTNRFTSEYGGNLSREALLDFFSKLSKNSVLTAFYALRFFYNAAGIEFPVERREIAPKGIKVQRTVLTPVEVEVLIKSSRKKLGSEIGYVELGFLALSTVYGFRRKELYSIRPDDIDLDNGVIYSSRFTAKIDVAERDNLIPDKIAGILEEFRKSLKKIKKNFKIQKMNQMLDYMCWTAGICMRPRLGFHSIRRSLISELMLKDISPVMIRDFIRWKPKERDILMHYTVLDWRRVDTEVFKVHPFLNHWVEDPDTITSSDNSAIVSEIQEV